MSHTVLWTEPWTLSPSTHPLRLVRGRSKWWGWFHSLLSYIHMHVYVYICIYIRMTPSYTHWFTYTYWCTYIYLILKVRKISPLNLTASAPLWVNDTVEAFRACPQYGSGASFVAILCILYYLFLYYNFHSVFDVFIDEHIYMGEWHHGPSGPVRSTDQVTACIEWLQFWIYVYTNVHI